MGYRAEEDEHLGDIECPNCGTRVYDEVIVCPNCGLHFYPDELNALYEPDIENQPTTFSAAAILTGWVASAAVAFAINWFVSRTWPGAAHNLLMNVLLFLAAPLGAFAGGYLAARIAGQAVLRRTMWHGLLVSALSLASAVLLEAYWHDLATEPLSLTALISWLVLLPAGPLGAWLWDHLAQQARQPVLLHNSEQQLYLELLARVRHDINVAERLIEYERRRRPQAKRIELIQTALYHLDRDNR